MRSRIVAMAIMPLALVAAMPGPLALGVHRPPGTQPGGSDLVWRNGTMTLRLTEQACQFDEVALMLELVESTASPPKAAVAFQPGRDAQPSCWVLDVAGDVVTRDAAGNEGFIPLGWFKRDAKI